jgi:signal transduction histidine kinase
MKKSIFKKRGLSGKLVVLFVVIAITFLVIVGASLSYFYKDHFKHRIKPHFIQYLEYVRQDIGLPADRQKAQLLADKLKIKIAIVDRQGTWTSTNLPLIVSFDDIEHKYTRGGVSYGEADINGDEYLSMTIADTTLLFDIGRIKGERERPRIFVPLLFLLLVLGILYFATRRLFSPILTIQQGVREIGSGNLDYRIDVTRRDELGVLAKDINKMADELQKMLDAKRQLLLAVSHELRSPLTRANVAVEMLDDNILKQQIKQDIQEVGGVISEILETERLSSHHQALDREEHNVNDICQELIDSQFNGQLIYHLPDEPVMASVDKVRIKLLLKNILSNALRYKTELVSLHVSEENDSVVFVIKDDGQGIAKDIIPHLTEPFYRADPARQRQTGGYGLGLYLCKVIVEAHGGALTIESSMGNSDVDKGTSVTVKIPLQ